MDPPDTPSPAPRLRPSPRRAALLDHQGTLPNEILRPTIRLVSAEDAKVYATSPFPTADSQILAAPTAAAPASGFPVPSNQAHAGAVSLTPSVTTSLCDAAAATTAPPVNLLPPTQRSQQQRHSSSSNSRHYGSIADTIANDSFNTSSTPVTPQSTLDERYTPSSASSNLDVDRRLAMAQGALSSSSPVSEQEEYTQRQRQLDEDEDEDEQLRHHYQLQLQLQHEHQYEYSTPASASNSSELSAGSSGRLSYRGTPSDFASSNRNRQYARPSAPTPSAMAPQTPGTGARSFGAISTRPSSLLPPSSNLGTPLSAASVGSSGTVVRSRASQIATPAGYYRLFPPQSRHSLQHQQSLRHPLGSVRSARSSSDPPLPAGMESEISPPSSGSPGSPVSPISPPPDRPRHDVYSSHAYAQSDSVFATSPPGHERIASASSPDVYGSSPPVPSSTSSRSSRRFSVPRRPIPERAQTNPNRFQLALSTVVSEGTAERSSSGANNYSNHHQSFASSYRGESPSWAVQESALDWPLPLASSDPYAQTSRSGERSPARSQIRVVSATDKELPPLPRSALPEPSRPRSVFFRPDRRTSQLRDELAQNRNSGASFTKKFGESIPGWARSYYAHEARNRATIGARPLSELRSPTSPSTSPRRHTHHPSRPLRRVSLRVPHSRPRAGERESFQRDSMLIAPVYDQPSFAGVRGSRLDLAGEYDWSPHLFYDRRSAMNRRTFFLEPSVDLSYEGKAPSRRNFQVWAFVLGFVFPLAWFVAAFFPLPPKYRTPPTTPGFERDLEKAFGPRDQARYENARWWRNVNRGMSLLGLGVIIAVVILVVVATTRNGNVLGSMS